MPKKKLKQTTLKNLGAVGSTQIILRFLSFFRYLILVRLLTPMDFGLFALASAWLALSKNFDDLGLEAALIQKKELNSSTLISSFWIRLFSALSFFILLIAAAPFLGEFFETEPLILILRTLALVLLLRLPGFVSKIQLTRTLSFQRISLFQLISGVFGIATTLVLAFMGFGVWSLVWGTLVGEFLNALLFFAYKKLSKDNIKISWKKINVSWQQTKKIRQFAWPLFGASIIGFLVTQLDDLIVGKLLGPVQLGFYTIAFIWANMVVILFVNPIGKVFFPTIAKIQDSPERVQRGYLDAIKWTALVIFPINFGLFALTPDFIEFVLGEKWLPASTAMRLLCLYGVLRGIGGIGGSVRKGLGYPSIFLKLGLVFLGLMLICIFPLTLKWGIAGTALAVLIPSVVTNILVYFSNQKLLQFKTSLFLNAILRPLSIAILFAGFLFVLNQFISFWWVLFYGVLAYGLLLYLFYRDELKELWQTVYRNE